MPTHNRLSNALDFASGANNILKHSRLFVAWLAAGCGAGALEAAMKYTSERKQFGKTIDSFQVSQEKISRALALVQSMITVCIRVSQLYEKDQCSMSHIA